MTIIMSPLDLPTKAKNRERIVVISIDDFNKAMTNYKNGKFLLDENICYLVRSKLKEKQINSHPLLKYLSDEGILNTGNILINQSNKDNEYKYIAVSKENTQKLAIKQMLDFNKLCQFLGADHVNFKILDTSKKDILGVLEVAGEMIGKGKGSIQSKYNKKEAIEQDITQESKYSPFKPGRIDLAEAEKLISSGIFEGNYVIESFYDRAKYIENRLESDVVEFSLTENFCTKLQAIAEIDLDASILKNVVGGEGKVKLIQECAKILKIKYTVTFPKPKN